MMSKKVKEDFLEVDDPIGGQNYVCLSFVDPDEIIQNKEAFPPQNKRADVINNGYISHTQQVPLPCDVQTLVREKKLSANKDKESSNVAIQHIFKLCTNIIVGAYEHAEGYTDDCQIHEKLLPKVKDRFGGLFLE